MVCSEIHEKYSKIELPFEQCYFCEDIEDCPHPDVSNDMKGRAIPPDECVRKDEIKLTQRLQIQK